MKISFIIPAFNEELFIERCIYSIFDEINRYPLPLDYEIIVVNNNSTDRTVELVNEIDNPNIEVIDCKDHQGITFARQAGFKKGRFDLQAYIDADNVIPYRWLETVFHTFHKQGSDDLICISGPLKFYGDTDVERKSAEYFYKITKAFHKVFPAIQGGNFVVRKEALQKIGGHSTDILFWGEDTDLAKRLSEVGKVELIPEMWVYSSSRRFEGQGKANTTFLYVLNYFSVHLLGKPLTKKHENYRSLN